MGAGRQVGWRRSAAFVGLVGLVASVLALGAVSASAQAPSTPEFSDGVRHVPPTMAPEDYTPPKGAPQIPGFSAIPPNDDSDPPDPPGPPALAPGEAETQRAEAEQTRHAAGIDLALRAEGAFRRVLSTGAKVPPIPDDRYTLTQTLSAEDADESSGPLQIRLLLDGEQLDSASATCRASDCELRNRYSLDTISLEAGVTHTLEVEIEAGGIETTDLFEFNLPKTQRIGDKPGWVIANQPLSAGASAGVNVAFGNLLFSQTDVSLPGPGLGVNLTRSFNSLDDDGDGRESPFGRGWVLNAGPDVEIRSIDEERAGNLDEQVQFAGPSGAISRFTDGRNVGGVFTYDGEKSGINATLIRQPDDDFELFLVGSRITYVFNDGGRLARQIASDGEHQLDYEYGNDRLQSIEDARGKELDFNYEGGHVSSIVYRPTGRTWRYGYNQADDLLTSYTQPDGTKWTYRYGPGKQLTDITDPLGNITHLDYSGFQSDRVQSLKRAFNVTRLVNTSFDYNLGGCDGDRALSRLTDPDGNETRFCFDEKGRVERTIDAAGNESTKNWSGLGNITSFSGPASPTGQIDYAEDGHAPRRIAFQGSAATTLDYANPDETNARFLPTEVSDPQGNGFTLDYSGEQLTDVFSGREADKNRISSFDYFPGDSGRKAGLLKSSENGSNKTSYEYDQDGDPERVNPPGDTVSPTNYQTNALGLITQVNDGSGSQQITLEPVFNQPTRVQFDGGREVQRAYDPNGNLGSQGDATGGRFNRIDFYNYDQRNLLAQHSIADGANSRVVETYLYFPNGNLGQIGDLSGLTTYDYNAVNLPRRLAAPGDPRPYEFEYQDDYQLRELRLPNQLSQDYQYKDGHLQRIKYGGPDGNPLPDIALDYEKSDGELQDLLRTRTIGNVKTRYDYDELNRLESAVTPGDPGPSYRYEYDGASNLKEIDGPGKTRKLDFNAADEVTSENGEDYGYDRAGALTKDPSGTFSYNSQAQNDRVDPKDEPALPLTYSGLGQTQRLSAGTDLFADNQLGLSLRLQPPDRLTYLTRFIPVGLERPATDPFTSASVRGQPLGQRLAGGENFYYLTDDQGSVIAVTDKDRELVREYEYEPYGALRDQSGSGPASIARFTGEFLDTSSGLYKIGARYYDPAIGRWTQRDPVLQPFDPVNSNPYVYAGADPVNLVDSSGLSTGLGTGAQCASADPAACTFFYLACGETLVASTGAVPMQDPVDCIGGDAGTGYPGQDLEDLTAFPFIDITPPGVPGIDGVLNQRFRTPSFRPGFAR